MRGETSKAASKLRCRQQEWPLYLSNRRYRFMARLLSGLLTNAISFVCFYVLLLRVIAPSLDGEHTTNEWRQI